MNAQNLLFAINPEFNDIPKMKKFISNRYHITFETASTLNKTKWFDYANKKGYLKAMISYRNSTKIFEWTNFDNWLKTIDVSPK